MRALIIVVIMTAGLAGCAHRDQGGTTTDSYSVGQTNGVGYAVPPERGGRPGGTGPGGSTIGGTGSAPDR